jgi:hypothetical protein
VHLNYCIMNSLCNSINIFTVETRHVDTTVRQHVDMVLRSHVLHLTSCNSETVKLSVFNYSTKMAYRGQGSKGLHCLHFDSTEGSGQSLTYAAFTSSKTTPSTHSFDVR